MKRIVCEMCESTNFVKEDGLFICQGCSCKYTVEEAKKMMVEISDDQAQEYSGGANESPENDSDIPIHSASSPNRLAVTVVKVGHETYTTASVASLSVLLGAEPSPVFVPGPDQVGHIGAEISVQNLAGKTIKYITVYLAPFNAVGDQVQCTVQGHSVYGIEITGPMAVGQKWEGYADGMWYNNSIVGAIVDHVHVIYTDGTEEIYEKEEFNKSASKNTVSSKSRTITIHRRKMLTASAVDVAVLKDNSSVFSIKSGESKFFTTDEQPFELCVYMNNSLNNEQRIMVERGDKNLDFEVYMEGFFGRVQLRRM